MTSRNDQDTYKELPTRDTIVTIRVVGSLAIVDPAMEDTLAPLLRYESAYFEPGGPSGCRQTVEGYRLYERNSRGALEIPAGVVPRVVAELRRRGHEVRQQDLRRFDLPAFTVDRDLFDRVGEPAKEFLVVLGREPLGQLHVPPGPPRDEFILGICKFFHQARALIPVATVQQARALENHLFQPLGGNVEAVNGRTWRSSRRIVICTYESFETVDDPGDWDIVIFPNAEQAITRRPGEARGRFQTQRVYAFAQPQRRHSRRSQLRLEALAGSVIFKLSCDADRSAHVRVVVANNPLGTARGTMSALERKRRLYWNNDRRNDVVAEVALGFCRGDMEALWPHGVLLGEDRLPVGHDGHLRVAVLVESPRHGRQLQKRLPEWPLLHSEPASTGVTPGRRNDLPWGLLSDRAIITAVRAHQLDQLNADVLIMAAGGDGSLVPPGYPPRSNVDPCREVLLVDFCDDLDRQARRETQRRLQAYADRGFRVEAPARWQIVR